MNNLARIISHGFAIVVVVLLGIGFVYQGELFPGLELPDFLVPESGKTADTGTHPGRSQSAATTGGETSGGEPVEAMPSVPAPATQAAAGITAQAAGESAKVSEAAPAAEEAGEGAATKVTPPETEETATVTESAIEPPQSAIEESIPPVVDKEEQGPAEGASMEEPEAKGGAIPAVVPPPPVPSDETAVQSRVEESVPVTGAQVGTGLHEPSPTPGMSAEIAMESESQTSGSGGQPESPEVNSGETAPGIPMPPVESATAAAPEGEPAVAGAGLAAGKSAGESSVKEKPYELLAAAREAFWLHEYDDAEKNYRALTELEPDNPDGYGELGNMYFAQGRWDDAAAAYYEAGTRLVKEGQLASARELVKVIRGLNGKQADELDKLINDAASSGND
jgi:hypothetical protein